MTAEIAAEPEIREQYGRLTVLERAGFTSGGKALVLCRCECGAQVVRHLGNLKSGRTSSCGCLRRETTARLNAERERVPLNQPPGYSVAHHHVRAARGKASEFTCEECGRQAMDWAYCHCDPDDELVDAALAYSLDPDYYIPLCRSCHLRADWERRYLLASNK